MDGNCRITMTARQTKISRNTAPPRMNAAACSGGSFKARTERLLSMKKYTMFKPLPIHQPLMYCHHPPNNRTAVTIHVKPMSLQIVAFT